MALPGASPDDAEQIMFAQSFELSYDRENPPLYTWLTLSAQSIFGVGLLPVVAIRFAALFAFYGFLYAAARLVLQDRVLAGLAALSPVALWFVGWDGLRNYTHSALLAASCAATLFAVLRLERRPGWAGYVGLGVALGCGMLSKYSFALFAGALFAASLFRTPLRARLVHPRMLVSVAVAALVFLPHGYWLAQHWGELGKAADQVLRAKEAVPGLLGRIEAGAHVAEMALQFALPLLPLFLVAFSRELIAARRRADANSHRGFLTTLYLVLLGAMVVGAAAFGVTSLRNHHLFLIATVPLMLFSLLPSGSVRPSSAAVFGDALLLLAIAAGIGTGAHAALDARACKKCHLHMPYDRYATQIRDAGFVGGTIVSFSTSFADPGENLRAHFPDSRLISLKHVHYRPPESAQPRGCLIVWDQARDPDIAAKIRREPIPSIGVALPDDIGVRIATAPLAFSDRPASALGYAVVTRGLGSCR